MFSFSYAVLLAVLSIGAQFVVFLRWIHRRMRDDEINRVFLRDLALRHLPCIYRALYRLAEQQGIALDEMPTAKHVDLQKDGRRPGSVSVPGSWYWRSAPLREKGLIRHWWARASSNIQTGTPWRCATSTTFSPNMLP